jgi:chitin disaccharide deacetylase
MRKIILTADDFGFSLPVNEAVEKAHRNGVLTAASLMVGGKAALDAVDRARRLPSLRVGLHIVLVGGSPVSPARAVPRLVGPGGEFSSRLFRAGVNFFFRPAVRRELEREIQAQFRAFQETGLPLDHVNSHNHMHLHPTVGGLILEIGRDFGMRAVRYPREPVLPSWRASRRSLAGKLAASLFLLPWQAFLKSRIRRARILRNDFVFGLNDSGKMGLPLVLRILRQLPPGVTEMYFHPCARDPESAQERGNHHSREELEALISPAFRQELLDSRIPRVSFSDLS